MNNSVKTTKDGICRLTQPRGSTLSWSEDSGLQILEQDGFYFKDLERTGELLPYEDWRLGAWERALDLAGRLSISEIAGLMLYSPHQVVPLDAGNTASDPQSPIWKDAPPDPKRVPRR